MRLSRFFITRPIFAAVIAVLITVVGAIAYFGLPVSQYPDIVPPTVTVTASYPGASAETVADTVAAPIEQEINGVDDMLYMSSQSTGDGTADDHRHLQAGHRPRCRAGAGPEPRRHRRAAPARGSAAARRRHAQDLARLPDGREPRLARQLARSRLHLQLRADPDPRPAGAARRRRRRPAVRRRATMRCGCGSIPAAPPRST